MWRDWGPGVVWDVAVWGREMRRKGGKFLGLMIGSCGFFSLGNCFWFGGFFYLFLSRFLIRSLRAMGGFQSLCFV